MMGMKSGVAKHLQDIAQHPICIIHCVAYNLELGVLDAIKQMPYLAIFEETVKGFIMPETISDCRKWKICLNVFKVLILHQKWVPCIQQLACGLKNIARK